MEERVKKDKIVTGEVRKKKKSGLSRFAEVFIAEDAGDVKSYIFKDVIVPAITDLIVDSIKKSAEMIFYGGVDRSRNGKKKYTNYSYSSSRSDRRRERSYRDEREYDDIFYESRGEAEAVLSQLDDIIDEYGVVTVLDVYDLSGLTGSAVDDKYGWTDLRSAKVVRSGGEWKIKLPRARPID